MLENRNVYVGHRYVPKIMGEWVNTESYEGLSIVTHEGNSFTSKKRVPIGVSITNEEYWASTGNYNAQIEEYRKDVKTVEDEITSHSTQLGVLSNYETNLASFPINPTETSDSLRFQRALDHLSSKGGGILRLPDGDYLINGEAPSVPSNVGIIGSRKARLYRTDGGYYVLKLQSKEHITLDGFVLDGGISSANADWSDEQKHTVVCSELKNSVLKNLTITNSGGDGIYIGDTPSTHATSENVIVENCVIEKVGRNGISITGASFCKVTKTKISGARGPIFGVGIDIEPNTMDTCIGNVLLDNQITNCLIGITIPSLGKTDRTNYGHLVRGNVVYENKIGLQSSGVDSSYIGNVSCDNEDYGFNIVSADNILIADNMIMNNGTLNSVNGQVSILNSTNILFTNNRIFNSDTNTANTNQHGIYLSGNVKNILLLNNDLNKLREGISHITNYATGSVYQRGNLKSTVDGIVEGSMLNYTTSDFVKTFLPNLNAYKGADTGKFSFRNGTPESFKDLFTVDNLGNGEFTGSIKTKSGNIETKWSLIRDTIRPTSFEGAFFYNQTSKYFEGYDGSLWLPIPMVKTGSTTSRPTTGIYVGYQYFDTAMNKPIWRNSSNNGWVDSLGASV